MEHKTTIGNVCFILDKTQKKILLLKRSRAPMQGLYTGVGGKTHFDEDIQASVFREVKEETGLDLAQVVLKAVVKTVLNETSWVLFVYLASTETEKLNPCPEGVLEWVDLKDLPSKPIIGFICEILPHVLHGNDVLETTIFHDIHGNILV